MQPEAQSDRARAKDADRKNKILVIGFRGALCIFLFFLAAQVSLTFQ
jgi:hypothetical protein